MSLNVRQSHHNRETSQYLARASPEYVDWEITTLFYSPLHMVDSYLFAKTGERPPHHTVRRRRVGAELPEISEQYRLLESLSIKSRYKLQLSTLSQAHQREALYCYEAIHAYVTKDTES